MSCMNRMVDCLNSRHCKGLQEAFFEFQASAEAHIGHEERALFSTIREYVDKQVLEDLVEKARRRRLTAQADNSSAGKMTR